MPCGRTSKMYAAAAAVTVVLAAASLFVAADGQVHHVVGGDRGWKHASDLAAWLDAGPIYRVGDKIWFTYSASQGGVYEVGSAEEYYTCDVSNPIRMYTDGVSSVELTGEGIRYFASSNTDSCKSGLKLHVAVLPATAAGPTTPAGSAHVAGTGSLIGVVAGLGLCLMGL